MSDRQGAFTLFIALTVLATTIVFSGGVAEPAPAWQVEWERTVGAAKREGQVNIYAGGPQSALPVEAGVFQKKFPEIKVITVTGDAVNRTLAERRAGKYLADVAIGGATTHTLYLAKALDSLKSAMILPEVRDESKWWQGKHRYLDPEGEYAFMFIGHPQSGGFYYNTKLVNPKEFQSFWTFSIPSGRGRSTPAISDLLAPERLT